MGEEVGRAVREADQIEQAQDVLARLARRRAVSLVVSGSAMIALTRMRGLSEAKGSWNTAWTDLR